jgi:hypothetical protein
MQICFRPYRHPLPEKLLRRSAACAVFFVILTLASSLAKAQTLAHPGWAGSGLTLQSWWQSALVYRVQPQFFQDSTGDGVGDLKGLAERLDYLQSIGVDAILLESHADDAGFDDLLSDASRHHIRILVQLAESTPAHPLTSQQEIDQARTWLRRGVAGLYLPTSVLRSIASRASYYDEVFLIHQLRTLADSFPGERILIAGDTPLVDATPHATRHDGAELIEGMVNTTNWNAASLRLGLAVANTPSAGEPLVAVEREPVASEPRNRDEVLGREKILAAMLLSSRGAVSIAYGQEIGLPASAQVMQWTPTNVTHPQAASTPAPEEVHYGAYHPYVRPAPSSVIGSQPNLPRVALDTSSAPPPVDPNTLPGFSTQPSAAASADPAQINVAVQDNDQESLLNFYRRVLELHSGNATLRTGTVSFLNHDGEGAVVWLRRAPAGARTVASVVVVCNLSEHPVTLSIDGDLASLRIRPGVLRPLLTSRHIDHNAQSTGHITLSSHSVYVGELYHY